MSSQSIHNPIAVGDSNPNVQLVAGTGSGGWVAGSETGADATPETQEPCVAGGPDGW